MTNLNLLIIFINKTRSVSDFSTGLDNTLISCKNKIKIIRAVD